MKKRFLPLCLGAVLMLSSCVAGSSSDSGSPAQKPTEIVVKDGYDRYDVADPNGKFLQGFGAQFDSHYFTSETSSMTETEFSELFRRCKEMNLQNIRTQIFPEWYERQNDNDDYGVFDFGAPGVDFESAEMKALYRVLDFCEENGVVVDLSFYGCNSIFSSIDGKVSGSWMGNKFVNHWITAPKLKNPDGSAFPGYEEFAESVYAGLKYLKETKGYTCIKEFSIYPEPNLSFVDERGVSTEDGGGWSYVAPGYVELCKIVDAKLKKEKIRDCAMFIGPADASTTLENYQRYTVELKGVFDKFMGSTYRFYNETDNKTFYDYASAVAGYAGEAGCDYGLSEFGTKSDTLTPDQTQAAIDCYERAVWIGRYAINFVNAGLTDMKLWILADVHYGSSMMPMGLWKFRDAGWEARPQYYTWSLIMKHTEVGAQIYPIKSDDPNVCVTAFNMPDGKWTYLLANDSDAVKKVAIVNAADIAPEGMDYYEVSEEALSQVNKKHVAPLGSVDYLIADNHVVYLELKPHSFVLLTDGDGYAASV